MTIYTSSLDTHKDIYGKPLRSGFRVVTVQKSKEYEVHYATHHKNPDILDIYNEFKLVDNKALWLSENRKRLEKHDINVNALIETWK